MPRRSISNSSPKDFEPKRKNPISLGSDSNLDKDLKPLIINDLTTNLELSIDGTFVRNELVADTIFTDKLTTGLIVGDASGEVFIEATSLHIGFGDGLKSITTGRDASYYATFRLNSILDTNDWAELSQFDFLGSLLIQTVEGATDTGAQAKILIRANNKIGFKVNKSATDYGNASANQITFEQGVRAHGSLIMNTEYELELQASTNTDLILSALGTGDIELNADGGNVWIKDDSANHFLFDCDNTRFRIYDDTNTSDHFTIAVGAEGATTISTVDADTAVGHLTLDADGDITLDASGDITLDAGGTDIYLKANGTTFGLIDGGTGAGKSRIFLYEAGGASTDDYFFIDTRTNGQTSIATVDAAGAGGHLALVPDGELNLMPATEVKSYAPLKIKEAANAVADTVAYGQLWVKTATPNELYFTTDAGDDIALTSGTSSAGGGSSEYYIQSSGRARCQYNNWYYTAHTTFGGNYYYWFYTTSSTSLPSAYADSLAPSYLVPKAGTVTGYTIVGNIGTTDTVEWALMKGAQPTYNSAGDFSLSQVGATQSAGGTSSILYKWEQTGLSVSVAKNDILMPMFRRTTDNDSTYVYIECSFHITIES